MEGYCVKCHKKVEMKDGKEVKTANNRNMMQGKCSVCGTKVSRFLPSK